MNKKNSTKLENHPLVSVGIPTFYRPEGLKRTIESITSQTYTNLEILISDDCSPVPKTEAVVKDFQKQDKRIQYYRQTENIGPTNNFRFVLDKAHGVYFMWAADDDWFDKNYIECCLLFLLKNPDYVLAGGKLKYFDNLIEVNHKFLSMNLQKNGCVGRVLEYYRILPSTNCSIFYGLMKSEPIKRIIIRNILGFDWIIVASLAFMGKIKTIDDTIMNRSIYGSSKDKKSLVESFRLPKIFILFFWYSVAYNVFRDILWRSNIYKKINIVTRSILATKCYLIMFKNYIFPYMFVVIFLRKIKHSLSFLIKKIIRKLKFL